MISDHLFRRTVFTAFLTIALISLGGTVTAITALQKYNALKDSNVSVYCETDATKDLSQNENFIISEYEGRIGVFDENKNLLYTLDVYIKTLPAKDRETLSKGLRANSREELYEILGDYNA